jgi:hypothetical protein
LPDDRLASIPDHEPEASLDQDATWFIADGKTGLFNYRLKGEPGGFTADRVTGILEETRFEFDYDGNREAKIPPRWEYEAFLLTKEFGPVMVLVGAPVGVSSLIDALVDVPTGAVIYIKLKVHKDSLYCNVFVWDPEKYNAKRGCNGDWVEQREKHTSGDAIERYKQSVVLAWKHSTFNPSRSDPYDPADPSTPLIKTKGGKPPETATTEPLQSTATATTRAQIDAQQGALAAFGYTWTRTPGEEQWAKAPAPQQLDNFEARCIANDVPGDLTAENLIRAVMSELRIPRHRNWNTLAGYFLINSLLQNGSIEAIDALMARVGYAQ